MSRQRFILPETFTSADFTSQSFGGRLLFLGLIATADDYGRGKANLRTLKAKIFPTDNVPLEQIGEWLVKLDETGVARVYTPHSVQYYDLPSWDKYQRPKYKSPSQIPQFQEDTRSRDKVVRIGSSGVVGCGVVRSGVIPPTPLKGGSVEIVGIETTPGKSAKGKVTFTQGLSLPKNPLAKVGAQVLHRVTRAERRRAELKIGEYHPNHPLPDGGLDNLGILKLKAKLKSLAEKCDEDGEAVVARVGDDPEIIKVTISLYRVRVAQESRLKGGK